MTLPESHVGLMRSSIETFLTRLKSYLGDCPKEPAAESRAAQDRVAAKRPESIVSAMSLGNLALEFAGDHLSCYTKIISEPIETLACCTCIRSMLETTAIATWVLDPTISSFDRIARVFAVRFDAIDQELKSAKCIECTTEVIQSLESRLNSVVMDAVALGYPCFRNKKNLIYAIGVVMPNATEMIRVVLNEERLYRLLSAVAHGQYWAIIRLGFQDAGPLVGSLAVAAANVKPMAKNVYVDVIVLLGKRGMLATSRLLWNKALYMGWDLLRLEEILEDVADIIEVDPKVRFWRWPVGQAPSTGSAGGIEPP